mmetsp:Transcript_47001/g.78811  ORF Transcript_47001/g.78811 Transcript_47001/m.78811 type:complete len:117 (-) Transcript_47001:694-1044(-)
MHHGGGLRRLLPQPQHRRGIFALMTLRTMLSARPPRVAQIMESKQVPHRTDGGRFAGLRRAPAAAAGVLTGLTGLAGSGALGTVEVALPLPQGVHDHSIEGNEEEVRESLHAPART